MLLLFGATHVESVGVEITKESQVGSQSIKAADVCRVMIFVSIVCGGIGALFFGKVEALSRYGSSAEVYVPALYTPWLIGGVLSAVFWWVLGEISGAVSRLERAVPESCSVQQTTNFAPKAATQPSSPVAEQAAQTWSKGKLLLIYAVVAGLGIALAIFLASKQGLIG
ncbi:hypothetical protein E5C31_11370 [Providencia rettgeri]|nr:hypothetical protein [Providencia rettgeri]